MSSFDPVPSNPSSQPQIAATQEAVLKGPESHERATKRPRTSDENTPTGEEDGTQQTIDEPDSRPRRRLPTRDVPMAPPFIFPNAYDMTDLPTQADENPIHHKSQQGEVPTLPQLTSTPFTRAIYPRITIPFSTLVANLDEQLVKVVSDAPDDFIAIVVFGAGSKFFRENPTANVEVRRFISSLGLPNQNVSVAKPAPKNKPNQKRDFEKPWTMILAGAEPELRNFLLWHQTFAVTPTLAFNALPFDKGIQSWVIMNISGDAVTDSQAAKNQALGIIKSHLWFNSKFRAFADRCLAALGVGESQAERACLVTMTYDLTYIETKDSQGNDAPIWQLTGKPITADPDRHKEYLGIIRGERYLVGVHFLEIEKRFVDCAGCKSDTHPAHMCPFPKIEDWMGPTPDNVERFLKRTEGSSGSKKGKSSPSSRGGKGSSSKGGPSKGGWQTVSRSRR